MSYSTIQLCPETNASCTFLLQDESHSGRHRFPGEGYYNWPEVVGEEVVVEYVVEGCVLGLRVTFVLVWDLRDSEICLRLRLSGEGPGVSSLVRVQDWYDYP